MLCLVMIHQAPPWRYNTGGGCGEAKIFEYIVYIMSQLCLINCEFLNVNGKGVTNFSWITTISINFGHDRRNVYFARGYNNWIGLF